MGTVKSGAPGNTASLCFVWIPCTRLMWDFKPHCELPNYQRPHTQQSAHESWGKVRHASRGLRGTEYSFRFFCLGEKSTCLSKALLSGVKTVTKQRKIWGGGTWHITCWFGSLMFQTESKVSSSDASQFSEFPWKSDTHAADCGLLGNSRVQHHTKNLEFTYSS